MSVLTLAVLAGAMLALGYAAWAQAQEEERPIMLELKEARIDDSLKMLFKSTPYSYVLGSDVAGKTITMSINPPGVTFAQALRAILDASGLTYRREGNVYYITQKQPTEVAPQPQVIQEAPASQMKLYWFGPGGRYEFQFLDCRTVSYWFGGWEAFMGIVPWAAEGGAGTGGGGGGVGGGGGGGGGTGGGGGGGTGGGGGGRTGGGGGGTGGGGGGGTGGGRGRRGR
jgi:hypothetical protein